MSELLERVSLGEILTTAKKSRLSKRVPMQPMKEMMNRRQPAAMPK